MLLSGDIETNPGPDSAQEDDLLAKVYATVQNLQTGQDTILGAIKELKERQKKTDERIESLEQRVLKLEGSTSAPETNISEQVSTLQSEIDEQVSTLQNEISGLKICRLRGAIA